MTPTPLILAVETSSRVGSVALAEGPNLLAESTFSAPMTHTGELFPTVQHLLSRFKRTPAQIQQLHISTGPGSFTGLRIAVTLAKLMHLAAQTKIVTVNSLDAIAANVIHLIPGDQLITKYEIRDAKFENIAVVLDAKRGQFFIAAYQLRPDNTTSPDQPTPPCSRTQESACPEPRDTSLAVWHKILPDSLMTAQQFLQDFAPPNRPVWLLGDGLLYHKDEFLADSIHFFDQTCWSPHASKVHLLGWQLAQANRFACPLTLQPNYVRAPDVTLKKSV